MASHWSSTNYNPSDDTCDSRVVISGTLMSTTCPFQTRVNPDTDKEETTWKRFGDVTINDATIPIPQLFVVAGLLELLNYMIFRS